MDTKSTILGFGVAIIFPDAVDNISAILDCLEGVYTIMPVKVLLHEKRKLTEEEAFHVYHLVTLNQLSKRGGGFTLPQLVRGLRGYYQKMKEMEEREVVLVALGNIKEHTPETLALVVARAWDLKAVPKWNVGFVTGEHAEKYRRLFSSEKMKEIENNATVLSKNLSSKQ